MTPTGTFHVSLTPDSALPRPGGRGTMADVGRQPLLSSMDGPPERTYETEIRTLHALFGAHPAVLRGASRTPNHDAVASTDRRPLGFLGPA